MKIFIRTFGCAHNQADSEMMAGQLEKAGHSLVKNEQEADLVLFNSCTVKDPSQKRFLHEVEQAQKQRKVVVAGCVPQGDPNNQAFSGVSAVGTKQIHKVVDVVERTAKGEVVQELTKTITNAPLLLPTKRRNPLIEIIPVNSGCLGRCTFCKTKHARGHLSSWSEEEIVTKAERAISQGVKELWLTSEDLGAYGRDIGTTIVSLAKKLLILKGDFKIRLGMANPPLMFDCIEGLIEVLQHPKCYRFIHIPLQAGSNRVLDAMQREYHVEEFEELVTQLKATIPDITIATDIIVGFPGETEEDFNQTMRVLEKHKFPVVNSSKFYARPGTPAAQMQPVQTHVIKQRSQRLHEWIESQNPYAELKGECEVLFTARGRNGSVLGRSPNYLQVSAKETSLLGKKANITIEKTDRFCAYAKE